MNGQEALHGTMMDIYANAKRLDGVLEIFQNHCVAQNDVQHYTILMKAYGNRNLANISEQICVSLLNGDHEIDVTQIDTLFHTLINTWAISTAPDAIHRAYNVLEMIRNHPQCIQNNIRLTCTVLLKCFLVILSRNPTTISMNGGIASDYAERIIVEIEQSTHFDVERYKLDQTNACYVMYRTAIKICIQVEDYERAESILHRLEQSGVLVPTKFYNDLVYQCTQLGTTASAMYGEKVLSRMVDQSKKLKKPALHPSERLYSKILSSWMKSRSVDDCSRMLDIYDNCLSKNEFFPVNDKTYNLLIPYFAQSRNTVVKADKLLQNMESQYRQPYPKPQRKAKNSKIETELPTQPACRMYVSVIQGYLDACDVESATKVLERQVGMCIEEIDPVKKHAMTPTRPVYFNIISGWIDIGDLEQASLLVESLQEFYDEGHLCIGPCIRTYHKLLQSYNQMPPELYTKRRDYYMKKYNDILQEMKMGTRKSITT
jgi:PPR repeat